MRGGEVGRAGRARPASSPRRATAWRRCCACRRASIRSRSSCSAPARTTAGSGRPATCSTGSPKKPPTSSPRNRQEQQAQPAAQVRNRKGRQQKLTAFLLVAPLHRRGVERQRGDRVDSRHHRPRRAPRVVGLQIPLADVARVEAVAAVAAGERRDAVADRRSGRTDT